ncbi:MAG: SDR family oxidoreductase, partial [Myxococcota bacterium]
RSQAAAEAVVAQITKAGGRARAIQADAGLPGAGAAAVADTVQHQGGLDILVSNAAVNVGGVLTELQDDDYEKVFGINVRGSLEVIRASAHHLGSGGRIVVISATIANHFFAPGLGLYGASKAALNAFVQGWSRDLGPRGITINAVVPGPIDTDMNPGQTELADWLRSQVPLGRYGTSDEVAALTAFLVGPEAGFITGARIIIDGGLTA